MGIHIGACEEGDHWLLSVKDNGRGIESAYINEIFEPFRRLHSWGDIEGTGLDWLLAKRSSKTTGDGFGRHHQRMPDARFFSPFRTCDRFQGGKVWPKYPARSCWRRQ